MIQVAYGDTADFNALVYGTKNPATVQYLQNQVSNFSQTLAYASNSFFSNIQQLVEETNGAEAMRLARAAIRKAGSMFQPNVIRSIWDIDGLQTAPLVMQRFIMAEPTVREMYHQQRCDGYADTYIDMHPGKIGEAHYDYRRVMDGMIVDYPEYDWRCTTYFEDLIEGDRHLELDEQNEILSTWDVIAAIMKQGDRDPTSVYDAKL